MKLELTDEFGHKWTAELEPIDKPEPVDKALQECMTYGGWAPDAKRMLQEINNRLKALEAKVG